MFGFLEDGVWMLGVRPCQTDTHFADILPPLPPAAQACQAEEPAGQEAGGVVTRKPGKKRCDPPLTPRPGPLSLCPARDGPASAGTGAIQPKLEADSPVSRCQPESRAFSCPGSYAPELDSRHSQPFHTAKPPRLRAEQAGAGRPAQISSWRDRGENAPGCPPQLGGRSAHGG